MADFVIRPSSLNGTLIVPPSKSHTLRAVLFAALAHGMSRIEQYLPSPDTHAMIEAVRLLGADVEQKGTTLTVRGLGGAPQVADDVIQCGNSGQVLRFVGALAGLMPQYTILTGDASIRSNRPIRPLLDGLNQLGAEAHSARGDGFAPIVIKGPLKNRYAKVDGADSQPVSGLLIAGALSPQGLELDVVNPGEKPWVALTLHWFKQLNIPYQQEGFTKYRLPGNARIKGFDYTVPGDFSTAAFPLAAALVTRSTLTLENIDMSDVQGDKALLFVLEKMGAKFTFKGRTLTIHPSQLKGMRIDINDFVDALPILAVIGCYAEGTTEITGATIARRKESDRIACITKELKKMGASIEEKPDGLIVHNSPLRGATVDAHRDHRLGMALSVAALGAAGESVIQGTECIAKTYPNFTRDFQAIGVSIS